MLKRILDLIPSAERSHLKSVAFSVFVCVLLDLAGLAALFPVILKVLQPDTEKMTTALICIGVFLFILLKNGLITLLSRYQTRFLMRVYKSLSLQLFRSYYERGLLYMKKRSSVQLGYEVNIQCYAFALNILKSLLILIAEGCLSLLMLAGLFIWEPLTGCILALGFIPVFWIYVKVIKKRMREYGQEEMEARREQSQTTVEAFRGFCELEVNQAFPTLTKNFLEGLETISDRRIRVETIQKMPLFLSEMAIILGLSLLLLTSTGNLTLVGGVFAVAAFRLIPAIRGMMSSWGTLQSFTYCLDVLEDGLAEPSTSEEQEETPLEFNQEITLKHIDFSFPDGGQILNNFNAVIHKGECVGIQGCSGSGKSTLFNIMLGFYPINNGEIRIDETPLNAQTIKSWHKLVGYVPQDVFIMRGTLAENIALGKDNYQEEAILKVLEQVKLLEWSKTLSKGIHTELGEFGSRISGGQKQRIGIARALYKQAQVLFFDEATSALDNETEKEINQAIQDLSQNHKELTLIIIAHRDSSLQFCDRIIMLDKN